MRILILQRNTQKCLIMFQLLKNPSRTLLLAPEIILSATSVKNVTSCGSQESPTSPVINSSAVVIFNKDQVRSRYCHDERIRIFFKDFGTEVFIRSLEKEIEVKNTLDYSELKQISKSAIITKASVNVQIPAAQKEDSLVITGLYQVVVEKEQTIVKIDNLESDLELFLIQVHGTPAYTLNHLLEMSKYGRSRVEIILPSQVIQSSLSLSSQLISLGIIDQGSYVYHHTTLKFIPQVRLNVY